MTIDARAALGGANDAAEHRAGAVNQTWTPRVVEPQDVLDARQRVGHQPAVA
jgi:hypothetical protein